MIIGRADQKVTSRIESAIWTDTHLPSWENVLPGDIVSMTNDIHIEFYTKWKPVKNGIYPYESIRTMKIFLWSNFEISKSSWITTMAKFRITKTDQIASDRKVLNVSKLCLFSIIREAKKIKYNWTIFSISMSNAI